MTYRIMCQGRGFYFVFNPAARPIVVTRRGETACQPGARHPFWRAVALWDRQGRRISADGLCGWDEPKTLRPRAAVGARSTLAGSQSEAAAGAA